MQVFPSRITCGAAALAFIVGCATDPAPLVPASVTAVGAASFNSVAGGPVASGSLPAVLVATADGKPVPGVAVLFAVTAGGGNISGSTDTTNAQGMATDASCTLGTTAGTNTLTATVAGVATPATFAATGVAGPAAKLGLTTSPSATVANRATFASQPVVQLQDQHSNAVST